VTLRNAVLGLTANAYEDSSSTPAGDLLLLLVVAGQLDMPYHAAIAPDGLRAITARITDKSNPWRTQDRRVHRHRRDGENLAQNALAYVGQLRSYTRGSGTDRLYADISKLIDKVDPSGEIGGIGARWPR